MCWLDATPPTASNVSIAVSTETLSRHRRNATWTGILELIVGRARTAFKQVPTPRELKPILPTMPDYEEPTSALIAG